MLGARVTKKMLLENAKAMPADRRAITNDVESVVWQYTLKPSTIAIMSYEDDEREYDEVAVLEAVLKARKSASRIAEVIHRSIPYPLVLVLRHDDQQLLSLAPKRFSRSERGATVAEEFVNTGWMDFGALSEPESQFIASVALPNLPQSNYLVLYAALVDRVIDLRSACRTGEYHVLNDARVRTERRRLLFEADDLEAQINECRAALKRESQFNRKVELSLKVKELEDRLHAATTKLVTQKNGA